MDDIDSELIFEGYLQLKLDIANAKFVDEAQLEGHELELWVGDTKPGTDQKYFIVLSTEPDPKYVKMVAEPLAHDYMNKFMSATEEWEEKNKQFQDSATHNSAGMGHPKLNFCSNCQKHGHEDPYCRDIFLNEEHYCNVYKIDGHWAGTCRKLHPELKEQHLAEQATKKTKATCEHCGKVGH